MKIILFLLLISANLFAQDSIKTKEEHISDLKNYLNNHLEKYTFKPNLIVVNDFSTIVILPNNNISYSIQTNINYQNKNFIRNTNNINFGITYVINFKNKKKDKLIF